VNGDDLILGETLGRTEAPQRTGRSGDENAQIISYTPSASDTYMIR
jgi:hypothetical protein